METVTQVPQQQTILEHIDRWNPSLCQELGCGEPIDTVWLHGGWTPDNRYRCPRHAFAYAQSQPAVERDEMRAGLLRVARMLGMLRLDDPLKRDALRVGDVELPHPPTLFGRRAPARPEGCDLDFFDIIGVSNRSVEDLENDPDLARHPLHHFPPMPPNYEGPTIVHVTLAITAAIPTQADWLGIYTWHANDPRRPYQSVFQGFDPLKKDAGAHRRIRNAIAWLGDSQREPGRRPRDRRDVCTTFRQQLSEAVRTVREEMARNGDPPNRDLLQEELAVALAISRDTLQRRMADCEMRWET